MEKLFYSSTLRLLTGLCILSTGLTFAQSTPPPAPKKRELTWNQLPNSVKQALASNHLQDDIQQLIMTEQNRLISYTVLVSKSDQVQEFQASISGVLSTATKTMMDSSIVKELQTWRQVPPSVQKAVQNLRVQKDDILRIVKREITPAKGDKNGVKVMAYVILHRFKDQIMELQIGEQGSLIAHLTSPSPEPIRPSVATSTVPFNKELTWNQLPQRARDLLAKENVRDLMVQLLMEGDRKSPTYRAKLLDLGKAVDLIYEGKGKSLKRIPNASPEKIPSDLLSWTLVPTIVQHIISEKVNRDDIISVTSKELPLDPASPEKKVKVFLSQTYKSGFPSKILMVQEDGKILKFEDKPETDEERKAREDEEEEERRRKEEEERDSQNPSSTTEANPNGE